jgi:hypothetical protein
MYAIFTIIIMFAIVHQFASTTSIASPTKRSLLSYLFDGFNAEIRPRPDHEQHIPIECYHNIPMSSYLRGMPVIFYTFGSNGCEIVYGSSVWHGTPNVFSSLKVCGNDCENNYEFVISGLY